ncbi:hypothetical protein [Roseibaca sp. Y0-43]|uniref:hypothetical protein n=1 Tax=Roseibaca sp. Y0-43 TaxID=2816854 RepID=UPI001D0CDAB4|nr:hypothetical protein [Roseibaca sp. Y0-43]MCC1481266.1 hypothetical protein [Roseibaca sp. Y0-43]
MSVGTDTIVEWLAQFNSEDGELITAYRAKALEVVKQQALADERITKQVIFVPVLRDDNPDLISDSDYFEIVNAANDGQIARIERMSEDELSAALNRYDKADGCPSRCYLVIYANGRTQCECLAGASGRGTIRVCTMQ